jgi:hypothetical protein
MLRSGYFQRLTRGVRSRSRFSRMTKAKRQHFVPQFLLRHFSTGRKNKAKLWVLDKRDARVYQSSVRDVGHENLFYEYHGEAGDFELEDLMQRIDSKGAEIISSITESAKFPASEEDRIWLSYFVATQMVRTPMTRKDMENFRQLVIHKWGEEIRAHPDDPKTLHEYGPEDAKVSSFLLVRDIPGFAKLLQEKVWTLCEAPRSMPYIISDNPVTRYNMIDRWPRGNLGLRNDGIEVYMPLSPRLTVHAVCPKLAAVALTTPDLAAPYSHAINEGTPVLQARENAEFANSLQVIWAERFVYAKEREHLNLPLDMLRTNPELRLGPGVRQNPEDD